MPVLSYDSPFQKHLQPGEQLRWVGRSRQGWRYRWFNRVLLLQIAAAVAALVWLAKFANACLSVAGIHLALPLSSPSPRLTLIVLAFVGFTTWQMIIERRRRAGTWYAVTDRRVLFVLTSVTPESVVSIEFHELCQVSLNTAMEFLGPLDGVILKLKHIDPYLAASRVLGYQNTYWSSNPARTSDKNAIILEDVDDSHEFIRQIVIAKLACASRS